MNFTKAFAVFMQIDSKEFTEDEKYEATGRSWNCHTRCDGYKEFQAKNEEEKNVIKKKNPYYKSLSKEKFMKRNALNRNRRGRK